MKVIILKENLNKGLNIVSRIAGRNLTLPILNNILISAEKNFLNLISTDLELGIKYWVLTKIEKEGNLTLPAKIFSNYIGFLPDKKLTLEVKNQILNIECENYQTQIKGLSAEEYPIIPKIEDKEFIELDILSFCEGLSQVVDFTAPNQTRPELSGVYFNFQKNRVQLTTTDSFRLAEKTISLAKTTNKDYVFILPQKAARELINIFSEERGKLRLYLSTNQVLFEYLMVETLHPQIQLISRLVEGEYPDYQSIIPKKYQVQVVLPKSELLGQIKTASIFSGKGNEVKITPNKNGIEILSQNPELGENKSFLAGKIDYDPAAQRELAIAFNYRFLIDGLLNIKTSEVIFELSGEEGPAVLKPVGEAGYLYVVMPIKST